MFSSLKTKIFVTTFFSFCALLITITLIFNKVFVDFYKQRLIENSNAVIEQYNIGFDEYVNRLRQLSYSILLHENVSRVLQEPPAEDILSSLEDEAHVSRFFQTLLIGNAEITGIAFVLEDGRFFHNSIGFNEFNYDFSYDFWDGKFNQYRVNDVAFFKEGNQRYSFTVIRELRMFPGDHLGYLVLLLDPNRAFNLIGSNNGGDTNIIVLDNNGNVIFTNYSDNDETYFMLLADLDGYLDSGESGDDRLIFHDTSELTGCTIVTVMRLYQMEQMRQFINSTGMTSGLTAFVISAIIALLVSKTFLNDIDKLTDRLALVGGGVSDVSFDYKQTKETGIICEAIKRMLGELNSMNLERLETAVRYEQILLENTKAELYTLQSQVNPHFLCNTMDSIRYKALKNKDEEVYHLISLVAQFLRDSLKLKQDTIQVSTEITLVEHYLQIQCFRFSDKISYKIDIDPKITELSVLKFILQPLVENALLHGLEPCLNPCSVTIEGRLIEGWIVFTITDNGVGIPAQKLDELNSMIASEGNMETKHIGISNTVRRLALFYGGIAKITIDSVEGQGTLVTVKLPAAV